MEMSPSRRTGQLLDAPETTASAATAGRRSRRIPGSSVRLRLAPSERHWLLRITDLLILNLALMATLALRLPYRFGLSAVRQAPLYFALLSFLWLVWSAFFDCYDLRRSSELGQAVWAAGRAALMSAVTYLVIPYITPDLLSSRLSSVIFVGLLTVSLPLWRGLYAAVFFQPTFQQRILIVGAGKCGAELARALVATPQPGDRRTGLGVQVVGFIDDDPGKAGAQVAGIPVLGDRHALRRMITEHRIDIVVLAITHVPAVHPDLFQILLGCREQGIELEPMVRIYERLTGRVPVDHAGSNLDVILPAAQPAGRRLFLLLKRLTDVVLACLGLLATAMLSPWVALANRATSPGPLFYSQIRVGKGGRPFRLVKFRSMIPNAEESSGAVWAKEKDTRVTQVGRLLRKTRLDEMPQSWNVLRGQMSLVGPRPERPEFVAELMTRLPFYQARHAVRPGMTGWAQVCYGYGGSEQDSLMKLQYDLYYIKHQSIDLELAILIKTASVMLHLRGR